MKFSRLRSIFFVAICLLNSSCRPGEEVSVLADMCVSILSDKEATARLVEEFDYFAKKKSLVIDKSHPLAREYKDVDSGAIIHISTGMGPFGTIVSFFEKNDELNGNFKNSFHEFVWGEIASRYEIRDCSGIEGFKLPKLYE